MASDWPGSSRPAARGPGSQREGEARPAPAFLLASRGGWEPSDIDVDQPEEPSAHEPGEGGPAGWLPEPFKAPGLAGDVYGR